jgi:hypothetical protein
VESVPARLVKRVALDIKGVSAMPISAPVADGVVSRVIKEGDAFIFESNSHGILLLYNLNRYRDEVSSGSGSFYYDLYLHRCSVSI